MNPSLARIDLQSKYRAAMASGNLTEMSALAEQIELLNRAAVRRRSTQKMLAVAFALDPSVTLAGHVPR